VIRTDYGMYNIHLNSIPITYFFFVSSMGSCFNKPSSNVEKTTKVSTLNIIVHNIIWNIESSLSHFSANGNWHSICFRLNILLFSSWNNGAQRYVFFILDFLHVYYFFPQWNTIHNRHILRTYLTYIRLW